MKAYLTSLLLLYLLPLMAQEYYKYPLTLLDKEEYEACIIASENAAICYQEAKNDTLYFYCYTLIAKCLTELDRQADFLKYEYELHHHYFLNEHAIRCLKNLALAHKANGKISKAEFYYSFSLAETNKIIKNQSEDYTDWIVEFYNDIGYFYRYLGDSQKALVYYEHSLSVLLSQKTKNEAEIKKCYAKFCYDYQDLEDLLAQKETNRREIQMRYVNIAVAHQNIDDYQKADTAIHKAKFFGAHQDLKDIYIELISIHLGLKNLDSAGYYLQKVLPNISNLSLSEQGRCKKFEGQVAFAMEAYQKAENCVQTSIKLRQGNYQGLLQSYLLLGKIYEKQNKTYLARIAFEKALQYAAFSQAKPTVKQIISRKEAFEIYDNLISLLIKQGKNEESLGLCNSVDSLITGLQIFYENEKSKIILQNKVAAFYHKAMRLAFSVGNIEKSFYFSEKIKGFILFFSLINITNQKIANIPVDIVVKERFLLKEIALWENNSEDKKNSIKFFELTQQLDSLKQKIKKQYPNYYELKYKTQPISLAEVQETLKPSEAMIDYVCGQVNGAWVITKDTLAFVPLPNMPSDTAVLSFFRLMQNKDTRLSVYLSRAYPFYNALIEPLEKVAMPQHWFIIPDATLNYLPFEALPNPKSDKVKPYLLHQKSISYHYSASLWAHLAKTQFVGEGGRNYFLAAVEDFDKNINMLSLGKGKNISSLLSEKWARGEQLLPAKKKDFVHHFEQEKKYPLVCLYTHSEGNDEVSEKCAIYLKDDVLNLSEVFSLQMKAGLVVLASCESGKGKIHKGEGMMSLARGFLYAGGESVLPTKWTVNEETTYKLLQFLIEELAKGQPKDIALQQAKIRYLAQDAEAIPYEWAAPFLVGNIEPISFLENKKEMGSLREILILITVFISLILIICKINR